MLENTRIILASASPRRRELLAKLGIEFEIITSDVEENTMQVKPDEIVKELSQMKASDVLDKIIEKNNLIVIGSDTVVAKDGHIMGKPKSYEDAFHMIRSIQGDTHQVYTGVSILSYNAETKDILTKSFTECTEVTVFSMTDEEIEEYLAFGDYADKAGAYGIQGAFGLYVEKINGDYNNVVGLPVARLYQELKEVAK